MYVKININQYILTEYTHRYNRVNGKLNHLEFIRLERSRNATNYFGPSWFNKQPHNIRTVPVKVFENKLKEYLVAMVTLSERIFQS